MEPQISFNIGYDGEFFFAEGVNVPVVTQGKSLDELFSNVNEALELYFDQSHLPRTSKTATKKTKRRLLFEMDLPYAKA